jgi:hypothetical protein
VLAHRLRTAHRERQVPPLARGEGIQQMLYIGGTGQRRGLRLPAALGLAAVALTESSQPICTWPRTGLCASGRALPPTRALRLHEGSAPPRLRAHLHTHARRGLIGARLHRRTLDLTKSSQPICTCLAQALRPAHISASARRPPACPRSSRSDWSAAT